MVGYDHPAGYLLRLSDDFTDSNSSTVEYFTVNFVLQFQFQLTEKIHTLQYKIAYTIAYAALSCIIFKYCYLFKNRCTIELSCLLFFYLF